MEVKLVVEQKEQKEYIENLKHALGWLMCTYKATLEGKSVRNVNEVFSYVELSFKVISFCLTRLATQW